MRTSHVVFALLTLALTPLALAQSDGSRIGEKLRTGQLSLSLAKADVLVNRDADGFAEFVGSESASYGLTGQPEIPWRIVTVLLPVDADQGSARAELRNVQFESVAGNWSVRPIPPAATYVNGWRVEQSSQGRNLVGGLDMSVYAADRVWPVEEVVVIHTGALRQYRLVKIGIPLARFNPVDGSLALLTGGELIISYDLLSSPASSTPTFLPVNDDPALKAVRRIAFNFDEMSSSYAASGSTSRGAPGYAIITTSAIQAGSNQLANFVSHKQSQGYEVQVVTEAQFGGGVGDVAAENIRLWLQQNYLSENIYYVLLIGNPDPAQEDVTRAIPMKITWPWSDLSEHPTDFYYADLTGNWDLDGDGKYGEHEEGGSEDDFGTGGVDVYWDVLVGRIPYYGVPQDLEAILAKMISYQSAEGASTIWRRRVLMPLEPSDDDTPHFQLGEQVKNNLLVPSGFDYYRIYDEGYGVSPWPETVPCNEANVVDAWTNTAFGLVLWATHGWSRGAVDVLTNTSVPLLNDAFPSFTWQSSCSNSLPEDTNNITFEILKNGGICTIGASRSSWYWVGQTNFVVNTDSDAAMGYQYIQRLLEGMSAGEALFDLKQDVWRNKLWTNYVVFNIWGDPSSFLTLADDCNLNGVSDECELDCGQPGGPCFDVPDCGTALDLDGNDVPDECDLDCNGNLTPDVLDISGGASEDCNLNGRPDECESGCNGNGIPDDCDIASGASQDCNDNDVPDECDVDSGASEDCNGNGIPDECDVAIGGASEDCNLNIFPDECELDATSGLIGIYFNSMDLSGERRVRIDPVVDFDWGDGGPFASIGSDGYSVRWTGYVETTAQAGAYRFYTRTDDGARLIVDDELLVDGWIDHGPTQYYGDITLEANTRYSLTMEYYENGGEAVAELYWRPPGGVQEIIPSSSLIPALDANDNGVPDDCEVDCNNNGVPDSLDISSGTSQDCTDDLIPDECQLDQYDDCDGSGVFDICELDGTAESIYGEPLLVQNTQTGFGDNNAGRVHFANGSELDSAYASIRGGFLYLVLAGNLETNYNKLEIFIESTSGGQNRLRGDNASVDGGGLNRMGDDGSGNGLVFDADFAPDYWIGVTGGGSPFYLYANYAELLTNGGGSGYYLGRTPIGNGGLLAEGFNPYGIRAAIDNSNVAGVSGGTGMGSGAGVTTGVEIAVPLEAIGSPVASIRVCAFINGQSHDWVSNQVLAPLGGGENLGEPRLVDFSSMAGSQYFTIPFDLDCNNNGLSDRCEAIDGGDFTADGSIDLDDFASFVECMAGPNVLPMPSDGDCVQACLSAFDEDGDDDVDLQDLAEYQRRHGM